MWRIGMRIYWKWGTFGDFYLYVNLRSVLSTAMNMHLEKPLTVIPRLERYAQYSVLASKAEVQTTASYRVAST